MSAGVGRVKQLVTIVGSDLSPIAAEYGAISACSTQNKAKRANKIVFLLLIRDQEVDGSNPFAPTTSFRTSNLQYTKKPKAFWLWARHSFFKSPARNQSFSSEFSVLR